MTSAPAGELVARARSGDRAAWELLYRNAYPSLIAFAHHRLGNADDAKEAVSETMTRAVAQIERYDRDDDGFRPWLFGILRHVVADQYRRRSRISDAPVPELAADLPDHVDGLLQAEDAAAVRAAFARLTQEERELLELRVVGRMSSDEAAAALGKKPGAVRMAQMRALARLRVFVEEAERV